MLSEYLELNMGELFGAQNEEALQMPPINVKEFIPEKIIARK